MKAGLFMAAFLILMLSASMGAAEDTKPESAEKTIQRLEAEIRVLRSTIETLVKENKELKTEIAALRAQGGKAASSSAAAENKADGAPKPKITDFAKKEHFVIGAIGRFAHAVQVEQILGPAEMILSMNVQVSEKRFGGSDNSPILTIPIFKRLRFWIQGLSTAGLDEEMERKLDTVFFIQGTRTLELVDGGAERLFVLVPYVPDAAAPKPGS